VEQIGHDLALGTILASACTDC